MATKFEAYTDGACKGNPGPGGWGVVLLENGQESVRCSGGDSDTTNNRMELLAAVEAMRLVMDKGLPYDSLTIITDSQYVNRGNMEWLEGWERKQFKDVKNADLWKTFSSLKQGLDGLNIAFNSLWVKGHDGNHFNEIADQLANEGVSKPEKLIDSTDVISVDTKSDPQEDAQKFDTAQFMYAVSKACLESKGNLQDFSRLTGIDVNVIKNLSDEPSNHQNYLR